MYEVVLKRGYATIKKNGKDIESLSGLYVTSYDLMELRELVEFANAAQHAGCTCGSLGQRKGDDWPHSKDCPYRLRQQLKNKNFEKP